jgi:acyl-CoA synthetase (NDP forming)
MSVIQQSETIPDDATRARTRESLGRLLKPRSIAVVGMSSSRPASSVEPMLRGGADFYMVNPNRDQVAGVPTVPSLSSIGKPVDAVMSFMSAPPTAELAEEAAGLDVGGMVLVSGGWAELSETGAMLQQRLVAAASSANMAVIGPNGLGFVNVPHRVSLTMAADHHRRPGGISIVSHSGAMLSGTAMAAWAYGGVGLNCIISAGNEAVTDLADYVDYFVEDPETKAIGLIVEKIRRPEAFFAAVDRATRANKPIVVLKLARSERSRMMTQSHTGALTGDTWVYDVALRQAGVALAYDIEELIDRLAMFDQLPPQRWTPVNGLGVLTRTGGFASLAVDLAAEEGLTLAPMDDDLEWLRERLPSASVANPVDAGGVNPKAWPEVLDRYVGSPELDAIFMIHPTSDQDMHISEARENHPVSYYLTAAARVSIPCVLANCSGVPAGWIEPHLVDGAVVRGRGLRPSLRGLATLGRFVRYRAALEDRPAPGERLLRPTDAAVPQPEGQMLPFGATMDLLAAHGIPVAPYQIVTPDAGAAQVRPGFDGPYVVKLADVAHRTEHGAVRLSIEADGLAAAIEELRVLAEHDELAATVAIQPMMQSEGEVLLGVQGDSELGPFVALGLGGIFAEALNRVQGRMAPLTRTEARAMIDELADVKVMHGFRGRPAWDLEALASILVAAGDLADRGRDWIGSLDVNPMMYGPGGFVAVDALLLLRPPE